MSNAAQWQKNKRIPGKGNLYTVVLNILVLGLVPGNNPNWLKIQPHQNRVKFYKTLGQEHANTMEKFVLYSEPRVIRGTFWMMERVLLMHRDIYRYIIVSYFCRNLPLLIQSHSLPLFWLIFDSLSRLICTSLDSESGFLLFFHAVYWIPSLLLMLNMRLQNGQVMFSHPHWKSIFQFFNWPIMLKERPARWSHLAHS